VHDRLLSQKSMAKSKTSNPSYSYVMFECCLINYIEKTAEILRYGIVRYALNKVSGTDYYILNEVINLHFDKLLSKDLSFHINASGLTNRPIDEWSLKNANSVLTNYLCNGGSNELYNVFIDQARIYYQISQAYKILKLQLVSGSYAGVLKSYRTIKEIVDNHESRFGKDALVSVKTQMLLEYIDGDNYRPDFELFKGYLAIKSIQGDKDYACTNKAFIISRMVGAKTPEISTHLIGSKEIEALYNRFKGQYFYKMLLINLQLNKFIASTITGNRCIYISTHLQTALLKAAIQNGNTVAQRKQKIEVIKAERKALKY
jgi:hypothetical protein